MPDQIEAFAGDTGRSIHQKEDRANNRDVAVQGMSVTWQTSHDILGAK